MINVAAYTDENPMEAPIRPNLGMRRMDMATLLRSAPELEYMKIFVFLTDATA